MSDKKYYVYILECADNTYYTGYTTDVKRREKAHNSEKSGAKYTRSRRPVHVIYIEQYDTMHDALAREAAIKKLSRKQKEALVQSQVTDSKTKFSES